MALDETMGASGEGTGAAPCGDPERGAGCERAGVRAPEESDAPTLPEDDELLGFVPLQPVKPLGLAPRLRPSGKVSAEVLGRRYRLWQLAAAFVGTGLLSFLLLLGLARLAARLLAALGQLLGALLQVLQRAGVNDQQPLLAALVAVVEIAQGGAG